MQNLAVNKILSMQNKDYVCFVDSQAHLFGCVDSFCPNQTKNRCQKTNKFFFKNSKFITGYAPIVFDDYAPYNIFFDNIKKYVCAQDINNKSKLLKKLLNIVQLSVFEYYGIGKPDEEKFLHLLKTYGDKNQDLSIAKLKQTNNSFCIERACLAHNFFKLIGINAQAVSQNVYVNEEKSLHMFNVVQIDDNYFVYDLINTYYTQSKPKPQFVFKQLDDKQGKMIFDDNEQANAVVLQNVSIKSQSGKDYVIDYGAKDQLCELKL